MQDAASLIMASGGFEQGRLLNFVDDDDLPGASITTERMMFLSELRVVVQQYAPRPNISIIFMLPDEGKNSDNQHQQIVPLLTPSIDCRAFSF